MSLESKYNSTNMAMDSNDAPIVSIYTWISRDRYKLGIYESGNFTLLCHSPKPGWVEEHPFGSTCISFSVVLNLGFNKGGCTTHSHVSNTRLVVVQ